MSISVSFWKKLMGYFRPRLPAQRATTDTSLAADIPIRCAEQDLLRRVKFADRIATVLSSLGVEEGRVFAIRGAWGCGKSSLKNLVIERLAVNDKVDWLEFNPWQWPDSERITKALFQEIANKIGGSYSAGAARRASKMRRYGKILTSTGTPLRKFAAGESLFQWLSNAALVSLAAGIGLSIPSATTAALIVGSLVCAAQCIGAVLNWLGQDPWNEPLDMVRRDLEANLRSAIRPVVIFVDDIDRLEPEQIRLLFRQVKANGNLPNLIFVLLFQSSIVEEALKPIAGTEGRQFLDKIVQTNFDLPPVPIERVHQIFTEQLAKQAGELASESNGFHQVRWGNVLIGCIQPYISNLRDVRRLLSAIAVHQSLHDGGSAFEVNIIDFIALETVRVFEPTLHTAIFRERDILLQRHQFWTDRQKSHIRERVDFILFAIPKERQKLATAVLTELFPPIAWIFGGTQYSDSTQTYWINEKRVCTDRFFYRYFELQAAEGSITESDFTDFVAAASNAPLLKSILEGFSARELNATLAARLDESVDRLPIEHAANLLPAMFNLGQDLVRTRIEDPFNAPWTSAWRSAARFLRRIPENERADLARYALEETEALSVMAILLSLEENETSEHRAEGHRSLFGETDRTSLKKLWVGKMEALAERPGALLNHDDLVSLLYRWRDFSGSIDGPRAWVAAAMDSDGIAALLPSFTSVELSQGWGDRVGERREYFNRKTIEEFFGQNVIEHRLANVDVNQLTPPQKRAFEMMSRQLEIWREEEDEI